MKPEFDTFQYFFTTHSNHFLDLTVDYNNISVYTFSKKNSDRDEYFEIENVDHGQRHILELIGARSSSVFLSNCTIWVEGITDRLYLRQYMKIYQKQMEQEGKKVFKEDYHYSFVEYGGNNITHWSFLDTEEPQHPNINVDRVCSKLFLITDKDDAGLKKDGTESGTASKKFQRHQMLQVKLGERYYCLNCREIENLLTKLVLKKIIQIKEDNQSLDFTQLDKEDYRHLRIGDFIAKTVTGLKRNYRADSGTVVDKVGFCKIAVTQINTIADLSDEAKVICKKLYEFIKMNN